MSLTAYFDSEFHDPAKGSHLKFAATDAERLLAPLRCGIQSAAMHRHFWQDRDGMMRLAIAFAYWGPVFPPSVGWWTTKVALSIVNFRAHFCAAECGATSRDTRRLA